MLLKPLTLFKPKPDGSYTWAQAWAGAVLSTAVMWGLMAIAYALQQPADSFSSAQGVAAAVTP